MKYHSQSSVLEDPNTISHSRSGKDPVHWMPIGPSERVAGVISGAEVSLAYRHSIERDPFPGGQL